MQNYLQTANSEQVQLYEKRERIANLNIEGQNDKIKNDKNKKYFKQLIDVFDL